MLNDGKVVPLKPGLDQPAELPLARIPVVLQQVRDKAAQQLRQGLQHLFDNADDTLFEMADKANSNADQHTFFEAMRDLRLKRKSIERGFMECFYEGFVRLGESAEPVASPVNEPVNFDKLTLLSNDDLERTVALDAMIGKVINRDGLALSQLCLRIEATVERDVGELLNPLGPAHLCECFMRAARNLGVEIKVKLLVLKLFEKYVLRDTDLLYADANNLLVTAGVLPELKALPPRRAADRSPHERRRSDHDPVRERDELDDSARQALSTLQSLLAHLRGGINPRIETSEGQVAPISSQDLLRLLSHLQQYVPAQDPHDDYDLRNQLEQLLTRVSLRSGKCRVVGVLDEDIINLVTLLFDYILDDAALPASLKVLIGRMQIPLLKVAVLDKSFFSRSNHPARRLLNEIAAAAMGWTDQDDHQRDVLFQRIEQIIGRLLGEFEDDPQIFSELLVEFLAFNNEERRRSELLEQRTRDAEEGRARAERARLRVQEAINERVLGKSLPEVVVCMLENAWSKVLQLVCLKFGDESQAWYDSTRTMDELIWSVEPHEDEGSRAQLLDLVPGLLKALRDGLTSAAFDPFATSEFFARLETLHLQTFNRQPFAGVPEEGVVQVIEEIVLGSPEEHDEGPTVQLSPDDPVLVQVDRLQPGRWVEWHEEDDQLQRCKLAAIIEGSGKYIFVNRTGLKVFEKTRMGLAVELRRGSFRLLDDAPVFDRALEAVLGRLRKREGR